MKRSLNIILWVVLLGATHFLYAQEVHIDEVIRIDIDSFGLGPCEPSIAINPQDPNNVVAGAILDRFYYSDDSGRTWTRGKLESSYGVYGDPVIRSDNQGNFYYAHLSLPKGTAYVDSSFLDRIVIQKSTDRGRTWSDGGHTMPRTPKDQDKQWLVIHPESHEVYMSWTEFDEYGNKDKDCKSRIVFSKSADGTVWSEPITISRDEGDCIDDDQTTEGAVPAIGPNGELYIVWSYDGKMYFDKSMDNGLTWMEEDVVIGVQKAGWVIDIPGLTRCNGMPIVVADNSSGPYSGNLYVNWGDQPTSDNTEIYFSRSTDGGNSWSDPITVHNDHNNKHQFLSWMTVDPVTGYIYIVYYDRRNHQDATTDVYLSYSIDGGVSFKDVKINETSFKPNPFVFFGDYNDISAYDGHIRPIWTQLDGKYLSVHTAIIEMDNLDKKPALKKRKCIFKKKNRA